MIKFNQKGFTHLVIIAIVVVVGVVGFAGYKVYQNRQVSAKAAGWTTRKSQKGQWSVRFCRSSGSVRFYVLNPTSKTLNIMTPNSYTPDGYVTGWHEFKVAARSNSSVRLIKSALSPLSLRVDETITQDNAYINNPSATNITSC